MIVPAPLWRRREASEDVAGVFEALAEKVGRVPARGFRRQASVSGRSTFSRRKIPRLRIRLCKCRQDKGLAAFLPVAFKLACCNRPATGRLRLPSDRDATNMLQPLEQEAGPVSTGGLQAGQEDLPARICGLVPLSADQRATEGRFPPDVTAPMLFLGYAAGLHSRRKLEATAWESLPKRHITNAFDSGRDGWRAVGVVCRSWRACRAMCRSWRACSVTAGRSRRTRAITKRSA